MQGTKYQAANSNRIIMLVFQSHQWFHNRINPSDSKLVTASLTSKKIMEQQSKDKLLDSKCENCQFVERSSQNHQNPRISNDR